MSILTQFLFGMIQGILPDILSTVKGALSKKRLRQFLDVDKDGDFDYDDIKPVPKCDIILNGQEKNEAVWNRIQKFNEFFKCARVQGKNHYETYFVS